MALVYEVKRDMSQGGDAFKVAWWNAILCFTRCNKEGEKPVMQKEMNHIRK